MIMVSYLKSRKIKKIYFEVISNNKFFLYTILLKEIANCQDFFQIHSLGTRQRRIRYSL